MRDLKGNWKDILAGFKIAFDPSKVMLAFMGVVLTVVGVLIIKALASHAGWLIILGVIVATLIILFLCFKEKGDRSRLYIAGGGILAAVVVGIIFYVSESLYAAVPYFAAGSWLLVVWSFFGGAITRIAAVEIATEERIGMKEAANFALKKYQAFIWSPLVPILGMLFLAFLIVVAGLICYIPYLGPIILTLILFPLMVIAGFVILIIEIGGVVGFELMFPAVSAEASDAFDAISRAYSYIFSQPWRWIYYNVIAVVYAAVCMLLVKIFAANIIGITAKCAGVWWGKFDSIFQGVQYYLNSLFKIINGITTIPLNWYNSFDPNHGWFILGDIADFWKTSTVLELFKVNKPSIGVPEAIGVFWISLFLWLFICLAASYIVSLAGSLQTLIYFLMRKNVDGTEMTEVSMEEPGELESSAFEEEKEQEAAPPAKPEEGESKEETTPETSERAKDLPPLEFDEGDQEKSGETEEK